MIPFPDVPILTIATACGKKFLKIKKHPEHPRKTGHTLPWHIIIVFFFQINSSFFNKKILVCLVFWWFVCLFFVFVFNNSNIYNNSVHYCILSSQHKHSVFLDRVSAKDSLLLPSPNLCVCRRWQAIPLRRSWIPSTPRSAGQIWLRVYSYKHSNEKLQPH